ncbi:hypothetical protein [Streptomyces sp. NPDC126503]|uniref:hypothetical protein n=1 Tax=Streptomyces sp. NPDC126503 TaxID=3155315 RepID=UPI0033297E4F
MREFAACSADFLLCRDMAAACSDSWFVRVADADHLERTDETADLACRFFAGRPLDDLPYSRGAERASSPAPP